jgi:hypothetical protein
MYGTLMLDEQGDLIEAVEVVDGDEYTTIAVALGAQQVGQALSLNVSTKQKDVWFNRSAGVDYNGLFYGATRSDDTMNPIRAQAFRQVIENTPGFGSYADTKDVRFTRAERRLAVDLPCVVIDCDNSRVVPAVIG